MSNDDGILVAAEQFRPAKRASNALTARAERQVLQWLAERAPAWLTSDQLTALGLASQIAAGLGYASVRLDRRALWLVIVCIGLNWLGDSLDGTLARTRRQQRPRYGFYVDHLVDILGAVAMMGGLGCSGLLHPWTAAAMLVAFLLLASESYLATYALSCFELSQGPFGPTEIRLLLIVGNLALLRSPLATVAGRRFLLFDLGGWIGVAGMSFMLLAVAVRHTARLYREEPLA